MSDSTVETIVVDKDDLLELLSLVMAASNIAASLNGGTESPAATHFNYTAWTVRAKYFDLDGLDDEELECHPAVVETEAMSFEITADALQVMLNDDDEYLGLARLFDKEPWTGRVTYPNPLHKVRREFREEITRWRALAAKERGEAVAGA